ncbi:ABC transporter permease [Erythrobacter sp. WG]|uniref:ABC transporter permease n=1 Tax=Erythrobacter sp. WG TaxID=2985510 RepID=UPI002271728C|nr:ABC transporter permease [Erythrobacter sp. WG]MCX9147322.1 ABC transporter permease [Erythrobacter sp. WG]
MWAAFRAVFAAIFADRAAALLLFGAPILYAVLYPSAYSGELVVDAPVVVVDLDRSGASRDLVRRTASVSQVQLVASLTSAREAESWLAADKASAAVIIPEGYARAIAEGRSGEVMLVGSGAHLLRSSSALTGIGAALASTAREAAFDQARAAGPAAPPALNLVTRPLFNTREGYGAAVFPGVAFIIVHQSLLLGLALLAGTARERLGAPLSVTPAQFAGLGLAASTIAMAQVCWFAGFVFWWQDYPRGAAPLWQVLAGASLFVAATAALVLLLASLFRTRERPLQLGLGISLPLFFLSGLTWPAAATPQPLVWLARLFPTTPGLEVMVGLNQMGGTLADYAGALANLAVLALAFGALAFWKWTSPQPLRSPFLAGSRQAGA